MVETIWFAAYECTLAPIGENHWHGDVAVPRWHPVRSVGLDDYRPILFNGEWVLFTKADTPRSAVVLEVWDMAVALKRMSLGCPEPV